MNAAGRFRTQAEQALEKLGASGAHQAVDADDFAGGDGQRHVVDEIAASVAAEQIVQAAYKLHRAHGETSPHNGKHISVGLVRLANIGAITAVAQALLASAAPENTRIHLCCYHARQLLLLRSRLENTLDRLLNRTEPENLFRQPEIIAATASQPEHNHIFIVLASLICIVGGYVV